MKPIKIRVRSPEHSEVIQKMLFATGCHWGSGSQHVEHYGESFLFVYEDGTITHSGHDEGDYFNRHPYTEVDFDWCTPERETIEIGGVKYYADEVKARLRELDPVE